MTMRSNGNLRWCALACLLSCGSQPLAEPTAAASPASASAPAPVVAAPTSPQFWSGTIELPGAVLSFHVALRQDGERWVGTIDTPEQGARGMPLDGIEVDPRRVVFGVGAVGAKWTIALDEHGEPSSCRLEQRGMTLECGVAAISAERYAELTAIPRPQMPQPPFDYDAIEVTFENAAAGTRLAGTLTIPRGGTPRPVLLLVSGSGPQDRDCTLLGHKPFWLIADHLARQGIAVLRVDDRGVGGSTGDRSTATTADFVGDALAGIEFLRKEPRIDPKRIGILGHSEGGIVAPAVAVANKDVAFVVLFAAPGLPGADLIVQQVEDLTRATGVAEDEVKRAGALQREVMDIVLAGGPDPELRAKLRKHLAGRPGVDDAALDVQIAQLTTPWYRHAMAYDPRPVLRKLKAPTLIVGGELDLQVNTARNVPAITKALRAGGNRKVTVHRLAGLNHLLQHAKTGLPMEYQTIEETMAPEVLKLLAQWILAR
jgi:uncharacterized protein